MPDKAWGTLNLMWVAYFVLIGAANLYVAMNFSEVTWGKFRIFGIYGMLLLFMVAQGFYIYRHMRHEAPATEGGE